MQSWIVQCLISFRTGLQQTQRKNTSTRKCAYMLVTPWHMTRTNIFACWEGSGQWPQRVNGRSRMHRQAHLKGNLYTSTSTSRPLMGSLVTYVFICWPITYWPIINHLHVSAFVFSHHYYVLCCLSALPLYRHASAVRCWVRTVLSRHRACQLKLPTCVHVFVACSIASAHTILVVCPSMRIFAGFTHHSSGSLRFLCAFMR